MFEQILDQLPEQSQACRLLYNAETGGYHLPPCDQNIPISFDNVSSFREIYPGNQYDCIEVPVADLIASLVVNTRSQLILETGTSRGFSSSHLAAAARVCAGQKARVITLDIDSLLSRMFEGTTLSSTIESYIGNSIDFNLEDAVGEREFDLMFFDSLHTYAHLSQEIGAFIYKLKLGGLLILHDTFFYDGLGILCFELMKTGKFEVLSFPTHRLHEIPKFRTPGVTILRKVEPIARGELLFPKNVPTLELEFDSIPDVSNFIEQFGTTSLVRSYYASRLFTVQARDPTSTALLQPVERN